MVKKYIKINRENKSKKEYSLYKIISSRNIGAITEKEQDKLANANVAVIGCGGLGGIAIDLLARTGIGNLTIADGDVFEISNLNRQVFSSYSVVGKKKVDIIKKRVLDISPSIKVRTYDKFVDSEEAAFRILKNHDIVIDGLDNVLSRIYLSRAAKDLQIPYVFGAAEKTRGYSTIFLPKGQSYESVFALPSNGKKIDKKLKERLAKAAGCYSILGITANLIGTIEAMQAVSLLLDKPFVSAPYFIHVSLFDPVPFRISTL
ncbi:MAG: HesA/MoeB/ThiF family protein [Candidatus Micrarchaeota archaeon]|nr:HesA/MoeB/ThiF family protein [Candidatus Micrarchaeota archaeon]